MIIDDEMWIRSLVKKLIPWHQLKLKFIGETENGISGYSLCKRYKPDIVITDIKMPGADGLEMIKSLKPVLPDTQFIIISGYDEFPLAKKAIHFGVLDYIIKPIDKKELTRILLAAINILNKNTTVMEEQILLKKEVGKLQNILTDEISAIKCSVKDERINKAINILHKHYSELLTLSFVADKVAMNSSYFSDVFKIETGSTFTEYLLKVRIKKAKDLLLNPEFKVKEIAHMTGFSNPNYFSRVFKKVTGKSPNRMRLVK